MLPELRPLEEECQRFGVLGTITDMQQLSDHMRAAAMQVSACAPPPSKKARKDSNISSSAAGIDQLEDARSATLAPEGAGVEA
eukprot:627117-Pelagomonas_calceolata.AAC.1